MADKVDLLIIRIIFLIFALITLFPILKPEAVIKLTAKWFKEIIKLYGFKGEIEPTPKAKLICRVWNLIMFSIFVLLIIFLQIFVVKGP